MFMDNMMIVYGFIVVFVLVAVYYYVECYSPLSKKEKKVKETIKDVKEYNNSTIAAKYEEFNQKMLENSLVKNAWQSYEKTLIKTINREGLTEVFSVTSSNDFFNPQKMSSEINLDFFQNFAGVFTGLGILGTFAGLSIGLYGLDLNNTKVAELQKGIGNLLGGMKTAFVTSLIGLVFALLFNYVHSKKVKQFENAVSDLSVNIDGLFTIRTAEEWLSKNYEEVQQQTVTLKNFDTELAMKVGNALDNSLERSLKPVMEQLLVTINKLNTSGIDAVGETIAASAGKEMKEFVQSLASMQQSMETLVKDSRSTNDEINRSMLDAVNKMKGTLEASGQNINSSFSEAVEKMNTALEKMLNESKTVNDEANRSLFETINKMKATLDESGKNMNINLAEATGKMNETIKGLLADSKSINEEINKSMLEAVNTMKETLVASGNNINANLTETSSKMTDNLSKHEQHMLYAFEHLEKAIKNAEELVSSAGKTAEQFGDAAEPVCNAVESINGQLKQITDANSQFIQKAEATAQFMRDAADKNQVTLQNIENSIATTEKAWQAYENNFDGIADEMERTLNNLHTNLTSYNKLTNDGLAEKLKIFQDRVTSIITSLDGNNEEIKDSIDDLQKAVKELNSILRSRR